MSIFDHQRLTNSTFKLDIERMRQGWYTDKYFVNVAVMLSALSKEGYTLAGKFSGIPVHFKGSEDLPRRPGGGDAMVHPPGWHNPGGGGG